MFLITITLIVMALCITAVIMTRRKTQKTMDALNRMLDEAMDGNFTERRFDESLLSSVESRFSRYLSASCVSSRRLAEEKDKIKELLADISHQTKTPLSNILLYAQLLEEQDLPEESRACVAALRGQSEKLSFLITSLVKLSRLETGVLKFHPVLNDIAPLLEEITAQYLPRAQARRLTLDAEPTEARAVFDYKWTAEALCNLLDNAVKYTPAGGNISIRVTEYEFFCRIDVSDTGIGISEEEQAKIFLRFYRSASLSEQDGVGIGLFLAREILSGQGGYLKVSSSPGRGSVFSAFLPR